ncbi:MAG: ThiF family adenylyltransferase [bacterium]
MAKRIVFTTPVKSFNSIVSPLGENDSRVATCRAGTCSRPGRSELLFQDCFHARKNRLPMSRLGGMDCPVFVEVMPRGVTRPRDTSWVTAAIREAQLPRAAYLALVIDDTSMQAYGWYFERGEYQPIDVLSLPGPRMLKLAVQPAPPLSIPVEQRRSRQQPAEQLDEHPEKAEQLDRLIMSVGEGDRARGEQRVLAAMALERVIVVGAGRAGLLLLLYLVKSGIARSGEIVVIDGDMVEEVNRDAMLLPPGAVGRPKAEAAAIIAQGFFPEVKVVPVVATLSDAVAADMVATSDVVFTCVDQDATRVGAAAIAARYHRVHFDLAGGGAYTADRRAVFGGEMRLWVPGSEGCAACLGDSDWERIRRQLSDDAESERYLRQASDASRERPGSSEPLLHMVLGTAMQTFWRLISGDQKESCWFHLDANGTLPDWSDWTNQRAGGRCPICSDDGLVGAGDWGQSW